MLAAQRLVVVLHQHRGGRRAALVQGVLELGPGRFEGHRSPEVGETRQHLQGARVHRQRQDLAPQSPRIGRALRRQLPWIEREHRHRSQVPRFVRWVDSNVTKIMMKILKSKNRSNIEDPKMFELRKNLKMMRRIIWLFATIRRTYRANFQMQNLYPIPY